MPHTQSYVLILFFTYCIIGWIWECLYVSACQRRWVNRGFLYGPWLPIYGFGAMVILFATSWCGGNPWLIFAFGALSATVLEYFTGAMMERIFHVRYWDYSHLPLNLKGHICLPVTLGWGVFSLALVRYANPFLVVWIEKIPTAAVDPVSLVLTILFVVDFTKSVQNALDMKALLKKLYEQNETIAHLRERIAESSERFADSSEHLRRQIKNAHSILRRNPSAVSRRHQKAINELKEQLNEKLTELKQKTKEKLHS